MMSYQIFHEKYWPPRTLLSDINGALHIIVMAYTKHQCLLVLYLQMFIDMNRGTAK